MTNAENLFGYHDEAVHSDRPEQSDPMTAIFNALQTIQGDCGAHSAAIAAVRQDIDSARQTMSGLREAIMPAIARRSSEAEMQQAIVMLANILNRITGSEPAPKTARRKYTQRAKIWSTRQAAKPANG